MVSMFISKAEREAQKIEAQRRTLELEKELAIEKEKQVTEMTQRYDLDNDMMLDCHCLYLDVPYKLREIAKQNYCEWDEDYKLWRFEVNPKYRKHLYNLDKNGIKIPEGFYFHKLDYKREVWYRWGMENGKYVASKKVFDYRSVCEWIPMT